MQTPAGPPSYFAIGCRLASDARYALTLSAAVLSINSGRAIAQQGLVHLSAVVTMRIASDSAALDNPAFMLVDGSGQIVVAERGDKLLRYYDATGRPRGTVGRSGAGPGEFLDMVHGGLLGDTVWMADVAVHRFTFIAPSRTVLREVPFPTQFYTGAGGARKLWPTPTLYPAAMYDNGTMLVTSVIVGPPFQMPAPPGNVGMFFPYFVMTIDGELVKVLGWEYQYSPNIGGVNVPFSADNQTVIAPDGSRVVFALMTGIDVHHPQYRIVALGSRGDTVFARDYPFKPDLISRHFADSVIASAVAHTRSAAHAASYRAMHLPAFFPPIDNVVVGRDGTIWLELHPQGSEHHWLELDPSGRPIGDLRLPENIDVQVAERGQLWAFAADDSDALGIVRYRITTR